MARGDTLMAVGLNIIRVFPPAAKLAVDTENVSKAQ